MGIQSEYKNDFEKYIEKEKSVIELINYTGKLLYNKGVELVFFRRHLIDINITEILRLHHYAKNFVNKEPDISDENLKLLSQKFNFGKGGTTPRDKQIDYEFIEKGKDKNQVYISILIKKE